MIPALAHGTATRPMVVPGGAGASLASAVTRAVMLPFPVTAWCTK